MARLASKGAIASTRQSGSHLKTALLGLVVLAAVLGMLNVVPASLHQELHASTSKEELRRETEGRTVRTQVQEGADLQASDGLGTADDDAGAGDAAQASGTQTYEVAFDSPDGTDADTSLTEQEQAEEERRQAEEEQKAAAAKQLDDVNTTPGEKYHVICSLGSGLYTQWQSRVAYYWYKKAKATCEQELGDECQMGGYTRLLHSGVPDDWIEEIPTVVVNPLPKEYESIANGYVVLDRPYAFKQWVDKYLEVIPENYIWMGEPDHIFIRAPPLWATPERPAAFPFFYIEPVQMKHIIDRFNPKAVPIDQFDPIGNSPVQIHKRQFASISEAWFNLSIAIKNDTEADREFGWVQEMYAYSIASATTLDKPIRYALHVEMQLQPPWDASLTSENGRPGIQIHFTYGNDFDINGTFTPGKVGGWHWDKRDWTNVYIPRNFPLPPGTNIAVKELVSRVNEAAEHLPRWDEFAGKLQTPSGPGEEAQQEVQQQRRRRLSSLATLPGTHAAVQLGYPPTPQVP